MLSNTSNPPNFELICLTRSNNFSFFPDWQNCQRSSALISSKWLSELWINYRKSHLAEAVSHLFFSTCKAVGCFLPHVFITISSKPCVMCRSCVIVRRYWPTAARGAALLLLRRMAIWGSLHITAHIYTVLLLVRLTCTSLCLPPTTRFFTRSVILTSPAR